MILSIVFYLPMKKFVGCLIWRSTTKLTRTNKLPKVVTTMHMASKTAMAIVDIVLKGAGQHSGPHGVGGRVVETENSKRNSRLLYSQLWNTTRLWNTLVLTSYEIIK